MKSIKHLPRLVHSSLRSSAYMFDISKVVEELILNSIDACCTKVHISLNIGVSYVKVDDDGLGITREGLELLGEKHITSKIDYADDVNPSIEGLNYKGETLGSLADVSILEIITKARGWPNGYRKVMKAWNCLFLGISDLRHDVGTTVIVRDLFYNQPVRQKYMQSSSKKVLHSVKKCVVRIALAHPQVSYKLVDIENDNVLLSTVACASPLPLIADAFGNDISYSLHEINASNKQYNLSGYLSRPTNVASTMAFQLLYINSRFVSKGPIHKLIDNLASDLEHSISLWRADPDVQNLKRIKFQGHASYILKLSCPMSMYDLSFESSESVAEFKDWSYVLAFIEQAILQFWEQLSRQILQDEPEKSNLENKKCDSSSPFPIYSPSELTALKFSSKNKENYTVESSAILPKNVGDRRTCPRKTTFSHKSGPRKDCSDADKCLKDASTISLVTDFSCDERHCANAPFLHSGFSGIDLTASTYQSSNRSCQMAFDNTFDAFTFDDNDVNIVYNNESLYFSPNTHHENDAASKSAFVLKKCRTKLDFLSDDFLETNHGSPDSVDEYEGHVSALGSRCLSNLDNKIAESMPFFELSFSPVKELQMDNSYVGNCMLDEDSTDYLGSTEVFLQNYSQDNKRVSNTRLQISTYGDDDSFLQCKKDIFFENPDDDFDRHALNRRVGRLQYKLQNIDKHIRSLNSPSLYKEQRCNVHKLLHKRSHSAPPFYKRKTKFSLRFNCSDGAFGKSADLLLVHDIAIAEETAQIPGDFLQDCHSFKAHVKKNSNECMNHGDEMSLAYKGKAQHIEKNLENQCYYHSDAEGLKPQINDIQDPVTDGSVLRSNTIKWRNGNSQFLVDTVGSTINKGHKFSSDYSDVLDISSGFLNLAGGFLQPESISRDSLKDAKVLLQLDRKFIPIMANGTLAIVDQHAADERIRLEELRRKVLSGEGNSVTYLESEQELELPEIACQLLHNYIEQVKKWGWGCSIDTQYSESFSRNLHVLNRRGCCIMLTAVPCILGISLNEKDLVEFLEQLAATDGSAAVPPSVNRILNFKACRGAIMFGDTLLPSECSLLVEELNKTSLCFQCAHGRPTTVPLVNMVELHKQLSILQLQTEEQPDCWHGLRRHRSSLERAQQRLEAAISHGKPAKI